MTAEMAPLLKMGNAVTTKNVVQKRNFCSVKSFFCSFAKPVSSKAFLRYQQMLCKMKDRDFGEKS